MTTWTWSERHARAMRHVEEGHGLPRCAKMAAVKLSVLRRWLTEADCASAKAPRPSHKRRYADD